MLFINENFTKWFNSNLTFKDIPTFDFTQVSNCQIFKATPVKWKEDSEILIIEREELLNKYSEFCWIWLIEESTDKNNPENFTTWLFCWSGLNWISINDVQIVNYLNKCIILIFHWDSDIWPFTTEILLFPFDKTKDYNFLSNLYNQEKTNIFIKDNKNIVINENKIYNKLYLNNDLEKILAAIDKDKLPNKMTEKEMNSLETEFFDKYNLPYMMNKLRKWEKKYIYLF